MPTVNVIERAFQLAREGRYQTLRQVEQKLKAEGFDNVSAHLDGRSLRRQLTKLLSAAAAEPVRAD